MIDDLRFTISKYFFAENGIMVQPVCEFNVKPAEANAPDWNQTDANAD